MTLTESPPTTVGAAAEPARVEAVSSAGVLAGAVTTAQSQSVGRLFVGASGLLAGGVTVLGALLAAERAGTGSPADLFGGLNSYFQMWTLHRLSFPLLVVMPLLVGVALVAVPSQVGATNVAFPRAALAAFWGWLIGAVIVIASVFAGGGWGALDGVTARENDAIALTLLGTGLAIVSLLVAAIVIAATVISSRAAGLTLLGIPAFAWSMLVASAVWLFTLPIVVANIVVVYADLRGRSPIAFGQPEGADIWLQVDWLVEQPAVYAMAIPVLGIAIDTLGSAVGSTPRRPEIVTTAIGLFGLLAIGGWSQDYFTAPSDHRDGFVYVAFGLAAVVPALVMFAAAADMVMRGSKQFSRLISVRAFGALASLKLVAAASVVGALRVIEPFDLLETTADSAVFIAVAGTGLIGATTAIWHWWPSLLGRNFGEWPGRAAVALIGAGTSLMVIVYTVAGFDGAGDLPARIVNVSDWVGDLYLVSSAGAVLSALGVFAVLGATSVGLPASFAAQLRGAGSTAAGAAAADAEASP